jgi:hypothetical protein
MQLLTILGEGRYSEGRTLSCVPLLDGYDTYRSMVSIAPTSISPRRVDELSPGPLLTLQLLLAWGYPRLGAIINGHYHSGVSASQLPNW